MAETTPPSWQPDPYRRYAQRYWDGSTWTSNVTDSSGNQLTDPPGPSAPPAFGGPSSLATGRAASGPPIPGVIAAAVGAVLLLLSLFVLNWYDFGADAKDAIRANASDVESVLGISANDAVDGITFSEGKKFVDKGADVSSPSEQYFNWGYLVAIAAVAFVFVALFVPNLRWPALAVALLFAVWHGYVVNDSGGEGAEIQLGAWAGAVGLAIAAMALLLPRPSTTT